jgi:hypothetical protein
MKDKLLHFLPTAIVLTGVCFLIFVVGQQNLRLGANDPQIQMAEDIAVALSNGSDAKAIITTKSVDMAQSLAPFISIYDANADLVVSNATLNGTTRIPPKGVILYTKEKGLQNRVTWQPSANVRSAVVVTRYVTPDRTGFVLVGRSLREVENRSRDLMYEVVVVYVLLLIVSFASQYLSSQHRKFK